MNNVIFTGPDGKKNEIMDIVKLREDIISNFYEYWGQGSGDGYIDLYQNSLKKATLMIGPNKEYGIYLHFIDVENRRDWLSLYDTDKLDRVVETADEIYASVGLFLPLELAWEGIVAFIESGDMSPKIKWITPDDIPENGNW